MPKPRLPIGEQVKRFLARHGVTADAPITAAVTDLMTDNLRYRDRIRTASDTPYAPDAELARENERLEAENDRLGALVPAAGTVVLSTADAAVWAAYQKLGKPEDVQKQIDELPTLRTTVNEAAGRTAAAEGAKLLGWNADATAALLKDKGLVVSFVDVNKDGKTIKVPHVRIASDEKAAPVALDAWVKDNASYLTPALITAPIPSTGTPFPPQSNTAVPPTTGDPVADFQKRTQAERDARPNPLFPPRTAAVT